MKQKKPYYSRHNLPPSKGKKKVKKEEVTIAWFVVIFVLAIVAIKIPEVILFGLFSYFIWILYRYYNDMHF